MTKFYDADDVATNVLDRGFRDFDPTDWRTLNDADVFNAYFDLVAKFSELKADPNLTYAENCVEYFSVIESILHSDIKRWAEAEIRNSRMGGMAA